MIARVAWNGTGLVGALRSMNVSREDPEPWTLEALICSTKTPRTCAVSAPSACAPARGIGDSGRPARSTLRAAVTDHYSDGGFSGGHMERPGLKRLLADV